MTLRCNKSLILSICLGGSLFGHADIGIAQEALQVAPAQIIVGQVLDVMLPIQAIPGNMIQEPRSDTVQRWIRGVIQNELNSIDELCKPTPEQRQQLLDLAEKQWKPRLVTTVKAYVEAQNQRIPVDVEYRVERLFGTWAKEVLSNEQNDLWSHELEGRLDLRRRIVIGRMLADVESKLGLTAAQMEKVAEILKERWKDSWWSMYRAGTLPETKFAWISSVLSDAQRTAGIDRSSPMVDQHFVQGATVDLPSRSLNDRFAIGEIRSDESIPLHKPEQERVAPDGDVNPERDENTVPAIPAVRAGGDDESN